MAYRAPLNDMGFLLDHVVGYNRVAETERFSEAAPETAKAILNEACRMCDEILAPLQRSGDLHPAYLENGVVRTSPGFAEGYRAIAEGGWVSISASPEYGGMGLPITLATAVNDMMSGACLSLQLNPLMTQGQIEALEYHADEAVKEVFLPKLVSGEWAGTMNLTEPQAGSDVGALASSAEENPDGTYSVTGQKIFISWGDNDFNANICHLVLARLPGGPAGTKGISLFLVPKYMPDENGNPGRANNLRVASLEHKLGLHGSPTAVMQYEGATGWLVGTAHDGMRTMFTMMNNARLGVAAQGIGVAEGAFQHALAYAVERKQGRSPIEGGTGAIMDHADVRRMLACMKADTFAARAIMLSCAVAIDMARATDDAQWAAMAGFLTPISKAFGTETGMRVSEIGLQVHGGMGFIEETGAAQYTRDVRVTSIYEGTNGIQAMDLAGRKLMDGGKVAEILLDEIDACVARAEEKLPELSALAGRASRDLRDATGWMVAQSDINERFAGAVPFLNAWGRVLGGKMHLAAALAEEDGGPRSRLATFYIKRLLPEYRGLLAHATAGAEELYALRPEDMAA
ncbi:MAG: acyl-CoA dehydrogenase [Roseovarius sp.]|nr:acyl-CoA dehydrogenase [Roseovarius sp.]